ncbi:MAG: hypothetical protein R3244_07650, partial [Thermoanaerobaculia bacterium]|nr:hypothetical protein [Thermoanaerobaculia bacterium]
DPARIVKLALAEALSAEELDLPAAAVRVQSEVPVGAGFGSSASVAVAVGAALRMLLDGELRLEAIERIAREVERREHGRPSGVDHSTVLHGGVLWMERSPGGDLVQRRLAGLESALDGFAVFDSGRPTETTGEMVEAVRRRFAGRPEQLEAILDAMERDVRALGDWLGEERREPRLLVELLRDFERRLEALQVVPPALRELVRRVEAAGGAAKISGAGALSGTAAGSLLVYHPERPPGSLSCLAGLRALEADLGVSGVEIEEAA